MKVETETESRQINPGPLDINQVNTHSLTSTPLYQTGVPTEHSSQYRGEECGQ